MLEALQIFTHHTIISIQLGDVDGLVNVDDVLALGVDLDETNTIRRVAMGMVGSGDCGGLMWLLAAMASRIGAMAMLALP